MDRLKRFLDEYSHLMHTFSKLTIDSLREEPLFHLLISAVSNLLNENVEKEVQKDSLIIESVFDAYHNGKRIPDDEFDAIFQKTELIDEAFLKRIGSLPLSVKFHHKEIKELRKKRLILIARFTCELLNHWIDHMDLYDALRLAYKRNEFRKIILQILHLYNLETRKIADSIKLPLFLKPAKDSIIKKLYHAMETTADRVAEEWSSRIFNPDP